MMTDSCGAPSAWEPLKLVEDHPDTPLIRAALYESGAGAILRGRTYIADQADEHGCLEVWQETTGLQDRLLGLAVPDGAGWHLGCTVCRAKLPGPDAGRCPDCRARNRRRRPRA
jgi:hypothetical protein